MIEISEGDVRRLENVLQSSAAMDTHITEKLLYSLVSIAQPKEVKDVLDIALKGSFKQARDKLLDVMLQHGLS